MSALKNSLDPVQILCLDGDGIGPEITAATRRVLQAVDDCFDLNLTFTSEDIGFVSLAASGTTFPDKVLDAAKAADGIVLGRFRPLITHQPAKAGLTHRVSCVNSWIFMPISGLQNLMRVYRRVLATRLIW